MTQTPVLFVHNRRCGGNVIGLSAEDYLNRTCDPGDDDRYPIFKFGPTYGRVNTWDDFLEEAPRGRKRYYSGHFPFGAARHIPGRVNYLTNVRDPEARLVSLSKSWGGGVEDPDAWLRTHWEADNGMTRRLAGIDPLRGKAHDFVNGRDLCEEGEFKATPEIFERAKVNLLENVAAVIVKEHLVESLVLAEKKLGWPPMYSFSRVHYNQTPQIDLPASRDLMVEIVEANVHDRALYALALSAFEDELRKADSETRDMIAARIAIDRMLYIPHRDILDMDEIVSLINRGLNELLSLGHRDVAFRVMALFVGHPFPGDSFRHYLMEDVVRRIGSKEEIEAVEYRYHNPYSF